jgi:hypothetical protein
LDYFILTPRIHNKYRVQEINPALFLFSFLKGCRVAFSSPPA